MFSDFGDCYRIYRACELVFTSTSSKTIQGASFFLQLSSKGHLTACFILNAKRKIRIAREGSGTSVAKFWGLYHQYHQSLSPIPLGLGLRFKRSRALKGLEAEAPKAEAHLSDGKWHLSAASDDNDKFLMKVRLKLSKNSFNSAITKIDLWSMLLVRIGSI